MISSLESSLYWYVPTYFGSNFKGYHKKVKNFQKISKIFKNIGKFFEKIFNFFDHQKKKRKKSRVKIDHRQNMVCHTPFNTEFNSVIGSNELISQISAVYEIVKNLTIGFRDRGSLFDSCGSGILPKAFVLKTFFEACVQVHKLLVST